MDARHIFIMNDLKGKRSAGKDTFLIWVLGEIGVQGIPYAVYNCGDSHG